MFVAAFLWHTSFLEGAARLYLGSQIQYYQDTNFFPNCQFSMGLDTTLMSLADNLLLQCSSFVIWWVFMTVLYQCSKGMTHSETPVWMRKLFHIFSGQKQPGGWLGWWLLFNTHGCLEIPQSTQRPCFACYCTKIKAGGVCIPESFNVRWATGYRREGKSNGTLSIF